jgi:nicotinate-nucleotide pyrophosphorylase
LFYALRCGVKNQNPTETAICVSGFSRGQPRRLRRARSGVDLISIGWLTHNVGILDIGLDFKAG